MTKTETPSKQGEGEPLPVAVQTAVRAVHAKKAQEVSVLDLRTTGGFTDFFVICSGTNPRQIQAIAEGVEETIKGASGERPALVEGLKQSEWVLLDYFNFIVHVFSRDARAYYALDRLWGNAVRHDFPDRDTSST
jgi:ribosome-associated protein